VTLTAVPTVPLVGRKLAIFGFTLNSLGLVPLPPGPTTFSGPDSAPQGTVAVICASESTENAAAVPSK
jgi:hypothetical protein